MLFGVFFKHFQDHCVALTADSLPKEPWNTGYWIWSNSKNIQVFLYIVQNIVGKKWSGSIFNIWWQFMQKIKYWQTIKIDDTCDQIILLVNI